MNKDFEKRINLWKKQIESNERLTLAEAKDILRDSSKPYKERVLRVFEGTIYIPIETISKIPFYIAEKPTLDVDDIITSALEEWYKIIKDYSLIDVPSFGRAADHSFVFKAVDDNLSSNEFELNRKFIGKKDVIDKALFDCIKLNYGKDLTVDDVKSVLSKYPIEEKIGDDPDSFENLSQTVFALYNKLNLSDDESLDLTERQYSFIKKLLRYDFVEDRLDKGIADNQTYDIEDETFAKLLKKMYDDTFFNGLKDGKVQYTILTDREKWLLDLRFGLSDGRPKTLEEVGKIMGIKREPARQIEAKALSKLRRSRYADEFKDYGRDYFKERESIKSRL